MTSSRKSFALIESLAQRKTKHYTSGALAHLRVRTSSAPADPLADPALEALRTAIPALRGLPLLARLARGDFGTLTLDCLPPMQLALELSPT